MLLTDTNLLDLVTSVRNISGWNKKKTVKIKLVSQIKNIQGLVYFDIHKVIRQYTNLKYITNYNL